MARFRLEREERIREFAEVQQLSKKLTAVMNSKSMPTDRLQGTALSNVRAGEQEGHPDQNLGATNVGSSQMQSPSSNPLGKSGSTPKRTKTRRGAKISSMHKAHTKVNFSSMKHIHGVSPTIKRCPLQDVGFNVQNLASSQSRKTGAAADVVQPFLGIRTDLHEASSPGELNLTGLSFNEWDAFTSTEQRPPSSSPFGLVGNTGDETTADI